MQSIRKPPKRRRSQPRGKRGKKLNRLIENDLIRKVSQDAYRDKVKRVYSGPQGALLCAGSFLTLHIPLGERIFKQRKFDLRGARNILDVGSGAGQIAQHVLRYADADGHLPCSGV